MEKKDKGLHKVRETCSFIHPFKSNPNLPDGVVHCLDLEGQQVHQKERGLKDDQIFHSLPYKRRGESCSYKMQFKENGNNGTVQYYLLARSIGFAVISKLPKKGNICSFGLEKQADSMIKLFIDRDILGHHFQAVTETPVISCIDCDNILCRCITSYLPMWSHRNNFLRLITLFKPLIFSGIHFRFIAASAIKC